ncbi:MAG TPA: hypothetical protein VF288_13215 [Mycobacteriales bacterium]
MSTYTNVVRYHLVQRFNYLILPWAILAFVFLVDVLILAATPAGHASHRYVGGLASLPVLGFVLGLQTVAQSLPFGLSFGSRRSYYLGTVLLTVGFSAIAAVVITVGQVIERPTHGWGLRMGFFRVPYILDGPWYLTWLTSFVVLALLFVYGMWYGLIHRRWSLVGLVTFIVVQVAVLLAGALLVTWVGAWHDIGHFFTALSAAGLTGLLAALTVLLAVGGFATMRRLTV